MVGLGLGTDFLGNIYVSTPDNLLKNRSFHVPTTLGYVMPVINSIDINEPEDLLLARTVGQHPEVWGKDY